METAGVTLALFVGVTVGAIALVRLIMRYFSPSRLHRWYQEFIERDDSRRPPS